MTQSKLNETNVDGMPHATVLGWDVIADLLQQGVALIPVAFNPFIAKGAAISRIVDKQRKPYSFTRLDFGT